MGRLSRVIAMPARETEKIIEAYLRARVRSTKTVTSWATNVSELPDTFEFDNNVLCRIGFMPIPIGSLRENAPELVMTVLF